MALPRKSAPYRKDTPFVFGGAAMQKHLRFHARGLNEVAQPVEPLHQTLAILPDKHHVLKREWRYEGRVQRTQVLTQQLPKKRENNAPDVSARTMDTRSIRVKS